MIGQFSGPYFTVLLVRFKSLFWLTKRYPHAFTLISDWFLEILTFVLIGWGEWFAFNFTTINEMLSFARFFSLVLICFAFSLSLFISRNSPEGGQ